jgi:hypothetical protein
MKRELYSIKKLFRIVNCFRFPSCSKKFIPNLKSWIFNSELIHSCAIYHIWGGELYSIKKLFRIVICFRFPYCSKKFIPNLESTYRAVHVFMIDRRALKRRFIDKNICPECHGAPAGVDDQCGILIFPNKCDARQARTKCLT